MFEAGIDRGVLYIDGEGFPWSGLVSVNETPSGGEPRPYYLDGVKRLNLSSKVEYEAIITALFSPPEFDDCDGLDSLRPGLLVSQQAKKSFGFCYRTRIGNDTSNIDHGYKIHIIYNALATPTDHNYETINGSPSPTLLSWRITTTPIPIPEAVRSSHLVIDTTRALPFAVAELEAILYGTELSDPRLPDPEEIISIFTDSSTFLVIDLGSGQFEISGSDLAVFMLSPGQYQITHDNVVPVDETRAQISS